MKFKLTDEEYAVLREIRKNERSSPERLKMMFYESTDKALKNLEEYNLIHSEMSEGRWYYYATKPGKEYQHEVESTGDPKQSKNIANLIKNKQSNNWEKFKHAFYIVVGIATIVGAVFAVLQFFNN